MLPCTPLPELQEILDAAVVVHLPMRTRFRGQSAREVMLLQGPAGWGEFGPFPEYGAAESARWLAAGIDAAWSGLGTPLRRSVPVNAILPAVSASDVDTVLARYGNLDAIPSVKIKVAEPGQDLDDDIARVREVHRLLPTAGIRVDANGAWSIPQAIPALEGIAEVVGQRFEYAEQPVAGIEPLAELRAELAAAEIPVRIAADEAVRKAEDPLRVASLGAADLIVVKVPPLGGVRRALEIVERSGLPAVVSSAVDTSVGLAAGLALAAQLPQLPYACGLGTIPLLASDVVDSPLVPVNGILDVPVSTQNGAVVVTAPQPNPALVASCAVTGERQRWWRKRLTAAYAELAQP